MNQVHRVLRLHNRNNGLQILMQQHAFSRMSSPSFSTSTLSSPSSTPSSPSSTPSSPSPIQVEVRNRIMMIQMNRPDKRNCVNPDMAVRLREAFIQLDTNDDVRCGVLYGAGGNFCAGYDLSTLAEVESVADLMTPAPMGPSHLMTKKPIVAAIDGYAVAGGLELALMCDLRVVEETAQMGVFCRRFGVPLIDGGTVRLPAIIGLGRALDMILTGRAVNGKEALSIGLASQCVAVGTALGRAYNLAESLTKFPQLCLQQDRKSAYYSTFDAVDMKDALDQEFNGGKHVVSTEGKDGASRFIDHGLGKHGKFNLNSWDELMNKNKPKSDLTNR